MNSEKIKSFMVKDPYPEISPDIVIEPDVIPMIIDSYSGSRGELTATCQYSYQGFLMKPSNEVLYDSLEAISINEMTHLEILSQALIYSKTDPKFCRYIDNNPMIASCWSASNLNYQKNIKQFLENNIKAKEHAIDVYKQIIETTTSQNLKDVISRIIKDEEAHIKMFLALLEMK